MFSEFTKDVKKVLTKYSQRIQANDQKKYGHHSSPDKIRVLDSIEGLRKSYKNWKNGLNNIEFQESVSFEKSLDNLEAMMDSKFNKLYDDWERRNRGAFTEDQILDLEEYCRNLESDNFDKQADADSDEDMRISKENLDELLSAGVVVNETKEGSADEASPDQSDIDDETKLQLSVEELDPESKDELLG